MSAPSARLDDLASVLVAREDAEAPSVGETALEVIPGLGADAGSTDAPPLRQVLRRYGSAPLLVLFALNVVDEFDRIAFTTLAPDIAHHFGLSDTALLAIGAVGGVIVIPLAIPFAMMADRGRRTIIAGAAALFWSIWAFATGLVRATWQLTFVRILSGVGKASESPVHGSLLADYYPVDARGRVYAAHQAANPVAAAVGPVLAGAIAAVAGGAAGWRWAFVLLAPFSVIAGLAAFSLREPVRGGHERTNVIANGIETANSEPEAADTPRIPLGTGVRRLLSIRSLRYLYVGIGVLGFGLVAGGTLVSLYFEEQWGVQEFGRGVIFSIAAAGSIVGLPVGGVVGDRLFRQDPAWPLFLIGAAIPAYTIVTSGALYLPQLWMVVTVYVLAGAFTALATAPLRLILAATAPPALRSLSFAMLGIFIFLFGGFLGGVILGSISDATSERTALTLLVVPGTISGILIAYGARFVKGDIAMVVEDIVEADRSRQRRFERERNLLEVRNLDFSYGAVQVLFDVDLEVREGNIVALLGTNGAGKSTLLRAISGLEHPTRGSIRFDGHDITYLEAEQVLGLGVAQMPGGRAVFPGMTVAENLRAGAYSFRKDRARVAREIEQVESWFPVLAERRDQLAVTLSGGEQQMLALGKAFLTHPKLFCIDELSLGLAPAVIAGLFAIIREMHDKGTTLILVEQSVNVALSLASTAVFMEKGHVRFQGPAEDLLLRPDLIRSVFLEGAAR